MGSGFPLHVRVVRFVFAPVLPALENWGMEAAWATSALNKAAGSKSRELLHLDRSFKLGATASAFVLILYIVTLPAADVDILLILALWLATISMVIAFTSAVLAEMLIGLAHRIEAIDGAEPAGGSMMAVAGFSLWLALVFFISHASVIGSSIFICSSLYCMVWAMRVIRQIAEAIRQSNGKSDHATRQKD